jgi:hypothetical protein
MVAMALLRRRPDRAAWFLAAVTGAGAALWWLSAPDPRFGLAYLVPLATLPLAVAISRRAAPAGGAARSWPAAAVAAFALVVAAALVGPEDPSRSIPTERPLAVTSWPAPPVAPVTVRTTDWGFRAYVPLGGDQCWAAPLPCTPELHPTLRAVDGTLRIR